MSRGGAMIPNRSRLREEALLFGFLFGVIDIPIDLGEHGREPLSIGLRFEAQDDGVIHATRAFLHAGQMRVHDSSDSIQPVPSQTRHSRVIPLPRSM